MHHHGSLSRLPALNRQTPGVPREFVPTDFPDDVVRAAKVFGSPVRLAILRALQDGPLRQQDLIEAVGIAYSTFRTNIAELLEAGAVQVVDPEARRGRQPISYVVALPEVRRLGATLLAWATESNNNQ